MEKRTLTEEDENERSSKRTKGSLSSNAEKQTNDDSTLEGIGDFFQSLKTETNAPLFTLRTTTINIDWPLPAVHSWVEVLSLCFII